VWGSYVETPRKPSTGLKHGLDSGPVRVVDVETTRKPSTGLKLRAPRILVADAGGRDTQKTQHGIETVDTETDQGGSGCVETPRKPSTGLKPPTEISPAPVSSRTPPPERALLYVEILRISSIRISFVWEERRPPVV